MEIFKPIITYEDIENSLVRIFTDSIITDTNFIIKDISESVVRILKYKKQQLVGKHISHVLYENDIDFTLLLSQQYFAHTKFSLKDSSDKKIDVFFSGYFLGLISDLNGRVIIIIKKHKDPFAKKDKLKRKLNDLDRLIYRTSHDLRGPLATIKGLTSIARNENDIDKTHNYFALINQIASKLELTLSYLETSFNKDKYKYELITTQDILRDIAEKIIRLNKVYNLKISLGEVKDAPDKPFFSNKYLLVTLIENMILIIESIRDIRNEPYSLALSASDDEVKIIIESKKIYHIVSKYLPDRLKKEVLRSEYNFLNLKIVKICTDILNANILYDENQESKISIIIPSQINTINKLHL